jgi:hypothetical protein
MPPGGCPGVAESRPGTRSRQPEATAADRRYVSSAKLASRRNGCLRNDQSVEGVGLSQFSVSKMSLW